MKKRYKYILLLACAQLFSSCGPSVAETLSGSQANTPNHSATAQVEANQAPFAPSSVHPDTKPVRGRDDTSEKSNVLTGQQAVERAQDNLAKRLNIPLETIELVLVTSRSKPGNKSEGADSVTTWFVRLTDGTTTYVYQVNHEGTVWLRNKTDIQGAKAP